MVGVFHQHWFSLRLDFDVDGPLNAVKELNRKPVAFDPLKNPGGRAFTFETTVFGTEHEAQRNMNLESDRSWIIFAPESRGSLGHQAGYHLKPLGNTTSCIPETRWGENVSFSQRHLWVTRYDRDELYSAGRYPNQAPRDYPDHLYSYAADDQDIYKQDVVLWYSLGTTHLSKPEDFPLMPGTHLGVDFAPMGFFQKSPALQQANIELVGPAVGPTSSNADSP
jgi:primary-amine oxidase